MLDRAAYLRNDDVKLLAFEGRRDSRAYVVHRNSLVVNKENGGSRALLTIHEAIEYGANPGTIFLGLREGAAIFGMGIGAPAVEKLFRAATMSRCLICAAWRCKAWCRPTSFLRSRWRNRWSTGINATAIAPIAATAPR